MASYKGLMLLKQDYLLRYIDELPDDTESNCDFDGYLEVDEWHVMSSSHHDYLQQHLPSIDSLEV